MSANIFLHYLNKDTQEIFGIANAENKAVLSNLQMGLNASVLLCDEYCFMPLGFYFECDNTKELILQNLDYVNEGLIRFCIRETDLKEYVEKKQGQLKKFADGVSYQRFYDKEYIEQLSCINPVYLQRSVKVGDFCVDRWVEQHILFLEKNDGDMLNAYKNINDESDKKKIVTGIQMAAVETDGKAFVWNVIEKKASEFSVRDKGLYHSLRNYFEKYYYEAYLKEYNASLLYDFYLIDRNYDFELRNEYASSANFMWFRTFLQCLNLEWCLLLPAGRIVELKNHPSFVALIKIYEKTCSSSIFEHNARSIRYLVSEMALENKSNINELALQVRDHIGNYSLGRKEFGMNHNERCSDTDVLIMIATVEEERAILNNDSGWTEKKTGDGYTYFEKKEGLTFYLARAINMREAETGVAGQYYIDQLHPRYISMAGFCAGEMGKTTLGDVIVAHKVYKYGEGKQDNDGNLLQEITTFQIAPIWKQKVERFGDAWRDKCEIPKPRDYDQQKYYIICDLLKADSEIEPQKLWSHEDYPDFPRVVTEFEKNHYIEMRNGKIKMTDIGKNELSNEMVMKYWNEYEEIKPTTKTGVLATGNNVQQWSKIFSHLSKQYDRKTIALDMEGHAIGRLSAFNKMQYIIAKGVGDFAKDGKEFDNRYIEYASYMSCRFIIAFFNSLDASEYV